MLRRMFNPLLLYYFVLILLIIVAIGGLYLGLIIIAGFSWLYRIANKIH